MKSVWRLYISISGFNSVIIGTYLSAWIRPPRGLSAVCGTSPDSLTMLQERLALPSRLARKKQLKKRQALWTAEVGQSGRKRDSLMSKCREVTATQIFTAGASWKEFWNSTFSLPANRLWSQMTTELISGALSDLSPTETWTDTLLDTTLVWNIFTIEHMHKGISGKRADPAPLTMGYMKSTTNNILCNKPALAWWTLFLKYQWKNGMWSNILLISDPSNESVNHAIVCGHSS